MKIKYIICVFLICIYFKMDAQAQIEIEKTKKYEHYIGIQANELMRQILNFSSSSSTTPTNPYLINYSINLRKSGWGAQCGFGYDYLNIKDKESPSNRSSKMNNFFGRIGVGRKVQLGKKFLLGYAFDLVADNQRNNIVSTNVLVSSTFTDSSTSVVNTKTVSLGCGFQANLSFYITPNLLLGTETSFYFMNSTDKQNIMVSNVTIQSLFNGSFSRTTRTISTNNEINTKKINFNIPVVLYLILKL